MTKQELVKKWKARYSDYRKMKNQLTEIGKADLAQGLVSEMILVNEIITDLKQLQTKKTKKTDGTNDTHSNA